MIASVVYMKRLPFRKLRLAADMKILSSSLLGYVGYLFMRKVTHLSLSYTDNLKFCFTQLFTY